MSESTNHFLERLRLRHVVLGVLVLAGLLPLALSSFLLVWQNRQVIEEQEREQLIQAAGTVSREVNSYLRELQQDALQLGTGIQTLAGGLPDASNSDAVQRFLQSFRSDPPDLLGLQIVQRDGQGYGVMPSKERFPQVDDALMDSFDRALDSAETQFRFVEMPEPAVVVASPVDSPERGAEGRLVVQLLSRLQLPRERGDAVEVFLLDGERLLWSANADEMSQEAVSSLALEGGVGGLSVNFVTEYDLPNGEAMLAQVSPVPESGWVVVVQKPVDAAFAAVNRMIFNSVALSLILLGLALGFALWAARRVSQPIQNLAQASHEIAGGNFGRRIPTRGLLFELANLGQDFNRMSGHVERYIGELQEAARANRDLFIGSLRAFAAAIDAKDPYTRGHSERVAAVSRIIARHLGMSEEFQERVWISGILHDVGKIGVEDAVLKKGGQLTDREFEQIKMHTVIGAEILSSIEQLKEMIPAVRWHHEAWNGRGYPDGLKGEEIPLIARVVAVADTFDAITTNRPYQKAYTLKFAVETIIKLTGSRFDAKITTAFLRAYETGELRPADETPQELPPPVEQGPAAVRSRVASLT